MGSNATFKHFPHNILNGSYLQRLCWQSEIFKFLVVQLYSYNKCGMWTFILYIVCKYLPKYLKVFTKWTYNGFKNFIQIQQGLGEIGENELGITKLLFYNNLDRIHTWQYSEKRVNNLIMLSPVQPSTMIASRKRLLILLPIFITYFNTTYKRSWFLAHVTLYFSSVCNALS